MKYKNSIIKFLILFSYLNILILVDGNISLRYLYDDISRLIILGQDFFITPIYIVLIVSILASFTDYIFNKVSDFYINKKIAYLYHFTVVSFSTLLVFYFLRIYDVSRFYLIIFLITCPFILIFSNRFVLNNFKPIYILIILIIGVVGNFFINSNSAVNKTLSVDRTVVENVFDDSVDVVKPIEKYINFIPNTDINEGIPIELNLSTEYVLKKFQICCFEYSFYENGGKSVGYLEINDDKLIYVTGSGIVLYTEKPNKQTSQVNFLEIKSNIKDVVLNSFIFDSIGWESIKDILIVNEEIYISYIEEVKNDCVNTSILRAKFNYEYLEFDKFFTYDECVLRSVSPFNAHQSGGKLINISDNEILLTTGDFRTYEKPQDLNSKFGKILKINLSTGEDQIVSVGHRNPQGAALSDDLSYVLISEHGPKGGDEINIINLSKVQNYGWPISSYGTHYDGGFNPEAPLHKSHKDYGFVEPVWYFDYAQNDVHGISAVDKNYFSKGNNFFVATLKGNMIYEVEVDFENSKVISISPIKVGARVRDMKYDEESNFYYLLMENTPSIALFVKTSN